MIIIFAHNLVFEFDENPQNMHLVELTVSTERGGAL